jgi:tyrosine-protein kinase Etk/Wzc
MQTIDPEAPAQPNAMPPRPNSEDEISLLDLLIVLAKRKRFILASTLLFGAGAVIVSLLLPSRYTATTVILPPQNSTAGSALLSQLSSMGPMASLAGGNLGIKNPNDMYVAMLKSRTVEDAMVQRFDLKAEYQAKRQSDARKAFEKRCDIQMSPKDGLIRISVTDRDPKRAAEMTNGYVEEYKKFSGTLAVTEASQRRLFFEQQLAQAKDNLANAEEALKKTQQTTGMIQMDSQARALIESAASLRAQIATKEVEIRSMRSFASDQNPDLLLAEQQLAGWQSQLSRLTGNQSGTEDDLLLSKGQVPGAGLEYVRKIRDVKYYDTIFELLAKQFEMAKLDEARQGSLIQVVDLAIPPDRRSSPKRTLITVVATAVGLFVGIFWVLVAAAFANTQKNPEDKERLEQLRTMLSRKPPVGSPQT